MAHDAVVSAILLGGFHAARRVEINTDDFVHEDKTISLGGCLAYAIKCVTEEQIQRPLLFDFAPTSEYGASASAVVDVSILLRLKMNWKKLLEEFRKFIDGADGEINVPALVAKRKASKWEELYLAIARELDQVMQRELFRVPRGPTLVPCEYLVFLKPDIDKEWQGERRKVLVNGLRSALWERAKELTGKAEMQERSFTVRLRADATLEEVPFRVQQVWDPQEETLLLETTAVRYFSVSVQRNVFGSEAAPPVIRPAYKNEITIGRGLKQEEIDLVLAGDREISRKHATLAKLDSGAFNLTCHSANPIILNDERRLRNGESAVVKPGDKIGLCSYELVIQ